MVMYSFSYFENGIKSPRNIPVLKETEVFEGNTKKELYELLIATPYLNSLCTKATKTEIVKNCTIDYTVLKDKDIAEDAYIVSHFITDCKKIVNINEPLYNYRTNLKSISRSYSPQKIERKNMLFLYQSFLNLLPEWGMDNQETAEKIYSACFDNALYLFREHYKYANGFKTRKTVLEYNWNSMLFDEIIANPHKYGSQINRQLYEKLSYKRYFSLRIWFLKNRTCQLYKRLKKG